VSRFFAIIFALFLYTAYKSTQVAPAHPYLAGVLTVPLFFVMLSWLFMYRSNSGVRFHDEAWFRALAWVGASVLGIWGSFVLFSVPVDLVRLVGGIFLRRDLLPAGLPLALLVAALITAFVGFVQAMSGPRVKKLTLRIEQLPTPFENLKIAQISDLHVGLSIREKYVEEVVRKTNAEAPDLIVVTGDLADGHPAALEKQLEPLKQLRARLGVFYVTGNHEYYWGIEEILPRIRNQGLIPLLNENRVLEIQGGKLLLAGITDPAAEDEARDLKAHQPDLKKALASDERPEFKILLSHRPETCIEAEKLGVDLQFSGHTHAGQFFPFSILMPLAHRYYRGLNRHGRLWVYVNPGTAYWGPANRFGIAPEITLLSLAKS
jgi:predicted MPP superfamily phosphohydrolase